MVRIDQPYASAKQQDSATLPSFAIWAVLWIVVLLALLPR
jgi:hypothetical protein